ncbi:MAG: preprotein translocase subunit SecE [Proteobacteria bacterium]|nr:preprotein translocase subunit SecE [Pseudomonadota bacterium]MBU1738935.1 preprotein translocase subunit SecE [Pseudomonadota bacterium]
MVDKNEKQSGKTKQKAVKQIEGSSQGFRFSQISEFATEVKVEFGKIAWPNKKHTVGSTMVVVVLVAIMAVYLGAVDLFLGKLIGYILG